MSPALEILHSRLPLVAIVGRPNVGKSTLFNRIVGRRKAVVLETPGMTRDRNFETAEWNGRVFSIVDTGGYESDPRDSIYEKMRQQSFLAIQEADVALLMTDVLESDNPVDRDVADLLRRSGKPVVIAVNKCDNTRRFQESVAFYALGFEDLFPISALSGAGTGDLLDRIVALLPPVVEGVDLRAREGIRIAVVGRPNVGKSSLVNAILGQERVIVSEIPGTTRDAIDTTFRVKTPPENQAGFPDEETGEEFQESDDETSGDEFDESDEESAEEPPARKTRERIYTLIDTAGLRRRGKIERGIEKLSIFSAEASLRRCDVALVLIDAGDGLTEQDKHVAGYAHEAHRACILIVNKWDLPEKDNATAGAFVKKLRDEMGFLRYAPVLLVSAKTRQRVHRILDMVDKAYAEFNKEISTPALNDWLAETTRRLSPPFHKGRQLSIKYVTQVRTGPPTFAFFVNSPELIHFSYERYLNNRLREAFGFEGTAIRLFFRRKNRRKGTEKEESSIRNEE